MSEDQVRREPLTLTSVLALLSRYFRTSVRPLFVPIVLVVLAVVATTARADNIIYLNPTATYLRTYDDSVSHNAKAYSLASMGFSPGQSIIITEFGSYNDGNDRTPEDSKKTNLIAVFSATDALISGTTSGDPGQVNVQDRVSGAIGVGGLYDVNAPRTYYGDLPTNIAQDFYISPPNSTSPGSSVTLVIPAGAAYVFFSPDDNLFYDNTTSASGGYGRYGVDIASVPESSSIVLFAIGLGVSGRLSRPFPACRRRRRCY